MTGFLAYAYLASAVVIPLILRSSGFGLESLFQMSRWPCGRVLQVLAVFVFALQVFAAIMWLSLRTRLFGEPILLWSGLALLFYLWVRALNVIRSRNKPA